MIFGKRESRADVEGPVVGRWKYASSQALFWWLTGIPLVVMASLQFISVRHESQTADEGRQLLSGYTYLITGHFTVAREHPPLLKLLWAIPVRLLDPSPPHGGEPWHAAVDFLYHNRVPADSMLMAGRSSAIGISILLGLAIAFWAKRHFGIVPALMAVFIYAADPNFLANGRYIKNDVGAALMIFAATMTWGEYLIEPSRKRLWICGIVVGLALVTKNSALILWLIMPLLWCVRRWQQRRNFAPGECLRTLGKTGIIAFLVIFAVYRFEIEPAGTSEEFTQIFPASSWEAHVPIPALGYFQGVGNLGIRQSGFALEVSYLMGDQSPKGWWYMSPVALAVKTPLSELALFLMVLGVAAGRLHRTRFRGIPFRWYLLFIPAVCYFAASVFSHSNVGERHLLPLLPFLFVFGTGMLLTGPIPRWRRVAVAAASLILVVETASIPPHYLAFFNALAGGPSGGRDFLVDSNLDWGQDLRNLKDYLETHHAGQACVAYYGWADLDYYRINYRGLQSVPDFEAAEQLDCVAAVSVTTLAIRHPDFAGFDGVEPDARIGYSIYVYDLRKRH